MNWKNVKLLLLILLVAVNLLLGYLIYESFSETSFTDTVTAKAAANVLEKSGILVDAEFLAVKNDHAKSFSAEYDREGYLLSVASFLLGEAPNVYLLPNGIRAENSSGDIALLSSDLSINFSAAGVDKTALLTNVPASEEEEVLARRTLEALLGYPEEAFNRMPVQKSGDIFLISLVQTEDNLPLFGFECTFGISNGKIVFAEGKHAFSVFSEESEAPLLNKINILLSEKSRGKVGKVEQITLCYTLFEDSKLGKLYLLPAYAVEYSDKTTSIISAINAELFE